MGQELKSRNNRYRLYLQKDGNLVLHDEGTVLWASNTSGKGDHSTLRMQTDGNLVLYDRHGTKTWSSETSGNEYARAWLQNDGNFVVIDTWVTGGYSFTPLWNSKTRGKGGPGCVHFANNGLNVNKCNPKKRFEVVCQKGEAILCKCRKTEGHFPFVYKKSSKQK